MPPYGHDGYVQAQRAPQDWAPGPGSQYQPLRQVLLAGARDAVSTVVFQRNGQYIASRQNLCAQLAGSIGKGAGCLDRVGLGPQGEVDGSPQAGAKLRFQAPRLFDRQQLQRIASRLQGNHLVSDVIVLLPGLDGLQCAGGSKLYIVAQFQLQVFEDLETTHGEVCLEVGDIPPPQGANTAGVHPRSLRGDITPLQQDNPAPKGSEMPCGGSAGYASPNHQDLGIRHSPLLQGFTGMRLRPENLPRKGS